MTSRIVAEALVVVPVVALGYWYNGRLQRVIEARRREDKSAATIIARTELESRVTREGWIVFVAVVVYWGLLSVIL
jgi:hypothetical protein